MKLFICLSQLDNQFAENNYNYSLVCLDSGNFPNFRVPALELYFLNKYKAISRFQFKSASFVSKYQKDTIATEITKSPILLVINKNISKIFLYDSVFNSEGELIWNFK